MSTETGGIRRRERAAVRRAYSSPLRERQARGTGEAILRAAAGFLADHTLMDFSIPAIAAAAGVSVRTVYRHFPSREALLEQLAYWLDEQAGPLRPAADLDSLLASPEAMFEGFEENAPLIRSQWSTPHGRAIREIGRQRRLATYRQALQEVTSNLSRLEAERAVAMIAFLFSSRTWQAMKDDFGMEGRESGKVVGWAVRTLVADLRRRNQEAKARKQLRRRQEDRDD